VFFLLLPRSAWAAEPVLDVRILSEDEAGVLFEYLLPEIGVDEVPGGRVVVRLPGAALSEPAGYPAVPSRAVLIALPPGANALVEILDIQSDGTGAYPIAPMPEMREGEPFFGDWAPDLPAGPWPKEWTEVTPPARLRDQRVVAIILHPLRFDRESGRTAVLRSARIRVRFEGGTSGAAPERGEEEKDPFGTVYRRALLNRSSAGAWKTRAAPPPKTTGPSFSSSADWIRLEIAGTGLYRVTYDRLVEAGVIDPGSAIGDPRGIRIFTGGGLPLPADLSSARPTWMEEIAIRVPGEEDASFDPGDAIEFYALGLSGWRGEFEPEALDDYEHVEHPYAKRNVYWLTWGGSFDGSPRRIVQVVAGPEAVGPSPVTLRTFSSRVHAEQDVLRDLTRYGEDGWFWDRFTPSETDKSFFLPTPDADTTEDARVRVRLFHYADALSPCGTERALLTINGVPSKLQEWNSCTMVDRAIQPFDYDSTAHWAADGYSRVDIEVFFRRKVYVCWIEMEYQRFFREREGALSFRISEPGEFRVPIAGFPGGLTSVLDVTDPKDVRELIGFASAGDSTVLYLSVDGPRSYLARRRGAAEPPAKIEIAHPADLRGAPSGAEYLVIAADEVFGAIGPLVAERSAEMSARAVRLSDIYANFSGGLPDPVAIRDFLSFSYYSAPEGGGPVYALLAGDATTDFLDREGSENKNILPSFLRVDRGGSDTNTYLTDDFFTYLDPDTGGGDWAPDIAIGRLPAENEEELDAMVAKIASYGDTDPGPWRGRVLFLADDERRGGDYDCGFLLAHTRDAETLTREVPDTFEKDRIYLVDYPMDDSGEKPEARAAYLEAMERGFLLSSYTGHGGWDKLGDEELLRLSDVSGDVPSRGSPLHLFAAWSCSVGEFALEEWDCLAEVLLKHPGSGAVGSIAASAPAFEGVSLSLAVGFVGALFSEPHERTPVGLALLSAKAVLPPGSRKTNDEKYNYLGDPALRLAVPELGVRFPGLDTLAVERGMEAIIRGEVVDGGGEIASSFEGTASLRLRGNLDDSGYTLLDSVCYGDPTHPRTYHADYPLLGPVMFDGRAEVHRGAFAVPFFVPLDSEIGPSGRADAYLLSPDGARDAFGGSDSLAILPEPDGFDPDDDEGPLLAIRADGRPLRDGAWLRMGAWFDLGLEDPSGIYQGIDEARRIGLRLDGGAKTDLTDLFALDANGYRKGSLRFRWADLPGTGTAEGEHTVAFRASDNLGNVVDAAYRLTFVAELPDLFFRQDVLNYPNPFDPGRDETEFFVDLSRDADVTVQIFTLTGKRIRTFEGCRASGATRLADCTWDGRDADGDRVANGVYLVRAIATTPDGAEAAESIGKAVVLRGR
jgi:hypothetical protein